MRNVLPMPNSHPILKMQQCLNRSSGTLGYCSDIFAACSDRYFALLMRMCIIIKQQTASRRSSPRRAPPPPTRSYINGRSKRRPQHTPTLQASQHKFLKSPDGGADLWRDGFIVNVPVPLPHLVDWTSVGVDECKASQLIYCQ